MPKSFNYPLSIIAEPDPYPRYKWMRDEDPAHYSADEDVWVLTRYGDVAGAFKDWRTWSSRRRGNLLHDMPERIGKTLGTTDPPEHTFARGLVDKAFTPRTVETLRPRIAELSRELVAQAAARQPMEFVADISAPFNAAILGTMFGVPEADFIHLRHWLDDFFLREEAPEGQEPPQAIAMRKLREYADALAGEKAASPGDDLLSAMIGAEEGGRTLSREQIVVTTMTFLTAGFESTNNLFTNMAYALARHPDVLGALRLAPERIPEFAEEDMRWDAPAQGFVRTPTRDVDLHGKTIPEGAQVLLHVGAANRDERAFEQPDTLMLGRPRKRHLAFGLGVHFCVGAPLGRLMAQQLFEDLIGASREWEIDTGQAVRVTTPNFRGFSRLPLGI